MRLLALALKSPGSWKSSTPPSRKTLHTRGLRHTQVIMAARAGSSHRPRWDSRWDLTSRLTKDDEILISCIRCHSQASLTVVSIVCIFLLSHQVMSLHHAAKFPSPTPYLTFNDKTNSFVFFICHLHVWGYWYFSRQSWFQLVCLPGQRFSWCTLHRS